MLSKPISFEIAKLLKEKGYSWECEEFYKKGKYDKQFYLTTGTEYDSDKNCIWDWNLSGGKSGMLSKIIPYPNENTAVYYSAPTIAEVIDWIYQKYDIWVWVERYSTLFRPYAEEINNERFGKLEGHKYDSPTKSYEAIIEYILTEIL
jgi:hypothetical protein